MIVEYWRVVSCLIASDIVRWTYIGCDISMVEYWRVVFCSIASDIVRCC